MQVQCAVHEVNLTLELAPGRLAGIHLNHNKGASQVLICPVVISAVMSQMQVQSAVDDINLTLKLAPGRLASGHLDDGAAHTPDVCLPAMPRLLDHLRGHPVGRPLHALVARICNVATHDTQVLDCIA